jgi:hypothetical protein
MELNKLAPKPSRIIKFTLLIAIILLTNSCKISYKFNGGTIDYTKTRTISIADFPNTAEMVYAPLSQEFAEKLRDVFTKQTRLQVLKKGGDMHIEGEIVGYQLTPMSIGTDSYASETKLTITINVRFTNNKNPADDFVDKKYTAFQTFDSNLMLNDVQDELLKTMIDEITDNIYNDTVAKW